MRCLPLGNISTRRLPIPRPALPVLEPSPTSMPSAAWNPPHKGYSSTPDQLPFGGVGLGTVQWWELRVINDHSRACDCCGTWKRSQRSNSYEPVRGLLNPNFDDRLLPPRRAVDHVKSQTRTSKLVSEFYFQNTNKITYTIIQQQNNHDTHIHERREPTIEQKGKYLL